MSTGTGYVGKKRNPTPKMRCPLRPKPKKIVLNTKGSEYGRVNEYGDAYEFEPDRFLTLSTRQIHRPLPAIMSLLAVSPQHRHNVMDEAALAVMQKIQEVEAKTGVEMPLLQHYRKLVSGTEKPGLLHHEDNSRHVVGAANTPSTSNVSSGGQEKGRPIICPLDALSSILSEGHHKKFKEFVEDLEKNGGKHKSLLRQREFRKLCDLLREERRLYALAIDNFRRQNVDRFKIGFSVYGPASQFVHVNSEYINKYRLRWRDATSKPSATYGKCSQAISLHRVSTSLNESTNYNSDIMNFYEKTSIDKRILKLDPESLSIKIVYKGDSKVLPQANHDWKELCNRLLHPCTSSNKPIKLPPLLCEDSKAKSLAAEYQADVLMTADVFEVLLQRPGHEMTGWMIPISSERCYSETNDVCQNIKSTSKERQTKEVTILEDPVPRSSTPRECLSKGMLDALYAQLVSKSNSQSKNSFEAQLVYTLLVLPKTGSHNSCKLIIRSLNYLQDKDGHPLKLRTQLEYFPERGREDYSSHEKSVWLMNRLLQQNCRVIVARIDPNKAEILGMEEKGVAHALANSDQNVIGQAFKQSEIGVSIHFQCMVDAVQGTSKLERVGRQVMCLPSRGTTASPASTISVHKCISDPKDEELVVDLKAEFLKAESVFLDTRSLMRCYQCWQWEASRIHYTFPFKDSLELEST